jgi:hypothetical protein
VKRQKNDAADAEAICEAAQRPTMRQRHIRCRYRPKGPLRVASGHWRQCAKWTLCRCLDLDQVLISAPDQSRGGQVQTQLPANDEGEEPQDQER